MIPLNHFIFAYIMGNVVSELRLDCKEMFVTVHKQSHNCLGNTRSGEEREVSKREALKNHKDDCQFNVNYSPQKEEKIY